MELTLDSIIELLEEVREDIDYRTCATLIDDAVLDSFDTIQIISTLNEEFGISIPAREIKPANFNSAQSILELVRRTRGAATQA